ncbi:MAG TPA: cadherin repeat domain-containing protein, partial [Gammaproteobacteria bacterium]|nr:cadherin repeat domain-containing protein [Gammaproteobacteria bacterium]
MLLLSGITLSANATNGVASVNSFVEEIAATDFRARAQNSGGQRSASGFDFIVTLESEDVSDAGTLTLEHDDDGNTSVSLNTASFPVNSYLVYLNDDHGSNSDRTSQIGEIVFSNEIYGIFTSSANTVFKANISKSGSTYPSAGDTSFSGRTFENFVFFGNSTSSSTTAGDWVSIGSDTKTLRVGAKNGLKGDYIRVITAAGDTTPPSFSSSAAVSVNENQTSAIDLNATDANTITYSISGGDSAHFNVNSSTGVVTFKVAPDFENPTDSDTNNTYSFTATATDTSGNFSQQDPVVVTVLDVTEAAEFTINAIADVSVNEGVAYTSV